MARNVYGLRHLCSRVELNVLPITMLMLQNDPFLHNSQLSQTFFPMSLSFLPTNHTFLESGILLGTMLAVYGVSAQPFFLGSASPFTPTREGWASCLQRCVLELAFL